MRMMKAINLDTEDTRFLEDLRKRILTDTGPNKILRFHEESSLYLQLKYAKPILPKHLKKN